MTTAVAKTEDKGIKGKVYDFLKARADSIGNLLSGFGIAEKDKGAAGRPLPFVPLTEQELKWLYRGNGHARRAVDALAELTTVKGWRVDVPITEETEDAEELEPPDVDPLELDDDDPAEPGDAVDDDDTGLDVMKDEDKRLAVWSNVGEAFRWARRDGGAWLFAVTREEDLAAYAEPLDLTKLDTVLNFVVVLREDVSIFDYDEDITSQNFRKPRLYLISMSTGGSVVRQEGLSLAGASIRVHHSRMIYFAGATVSDRERFENGGVDDSILQAWWDQIRNLTTVEQAGANLSQEMVLHVIKSSMPEISEPYEKIKFFEERMRVLARSKSSVGAILLSDDESYQTIASNVTGFKEFQGAAKDAYAAVTGMPHTELFGQAPGGLSTDDKSGRITKNTLASTVQSKRLKKPLVQVYTMLFAQKGTVEQEDGSQRPASPTGGVIPLTWDLTFNPVQAKSDEEQAQLEKTHAETDAIRINSQVVTPEHVAESRFGPNGYQNQLAAIDLDEMEAGTFAELEKVRAELERAQQQPPQPPGGEPDPPQPPEPPEPPEPGDDDDDGGDGGD